MFTWQNTCLHCNSLTRIVVENRGLSSPALFFVRLLYSPLKKCPFYQSSVSLKCPHSWWRHKHSFRPLAPVSQSPLSSLGLSVCPQFPLPTTLSVCVEVLSESRNLPMPVSKGILSIWKDYSFVIISRKGVFVDLLCEDFVMMTPNHIHRPQLCFFTFEWLSLHEKQRVVWGLPRSGQSRVHCFWMKAKVWFHPVCIACPFSYTKSVHGCLMLLECFLARLHSSISKQIDCLILWPMLIFPS